MVAKAIANFRYHTRNPEFHYTKESGNVPTMRFEGEYAPMRQLYYAILNDPLLTSADMVQVGDTPHYVVTANYIDPYLTPEPQDSFEIEDNQLQQPTIQNLVLQTALGGADMVTFVVQQWENMKNNTETLTEADLSIDVTFTDATQNAAAKKFLRELMGGVETFINFHTVFRRSITVIPGQQTAWIFTGVNKVWTTAQVIAFEGAPTDGVTTFTLPEDYYWLKIPPRIIAATNQRTQISYEYWGANEWSSLYYQAYAP